MFVCAGSQYDPLPPAPNCAVIRCKLNHNLKMSTTNFLISLTINNVRFLFRKGKH